ncbi:hypothetical protein LC55x_3689 [Lysobacter capsici]|nr:hypothetical protein LC55x_3689 [Lysobacter capsici]
MYGETRCVCLRRIGRPIRSSALHYSANRRRNDRFGKVRLMRLMVEAVGPGALVSDRGDLSEKRRG